jgi:tRNA(fMet)-specific endonuclease VapC
MRYLLDTNTCIAVMRNHPAAIRRLAAIAPTDCAVSTITSYELHTGVEKCQNPANERAKVDLLLQTIQELPFEVAAAKEAARIRAMLESVGLPIGPYDTLLAGHAMSLSLVLATSNTTEFMRVPRLTPEDWLI